MKNHGNECSVTANGICTCSEGSDTLTLVEANKALVRECEQYLQRIEELRAENEELKQDNTELAEYPWGKGWTYWLTSAVAGSVVLGVAATIGARLFI